MGPPLLIALAAGPAVAQPRTDTREAAMHATAAEPMASDARVTWAIDATAAQITRREGGATGLQGAAGAIAEVRVGSGPCQYVSAGARADASLGADAPPSAAAWSAFCLSQDGRALAGELAFEWDATPALLAQPRVPFEPGRRQILTVGSSGTGAHARAADGSPARHWASVFGFSGRTGVGWDRDGTPYDLGGSFELRVASYGRLQSDDASAPPLEVQVLTLGVEIAGAQRRSPTPSEAPQATTVSLDAVRVSGKRLGAWTVGARAGLAMLDLRAGRGNARRRSHAATPTTGVELQHAAGSGRIRLAAERSAWPLWDGRGAIDDRVTVGLADPHGRLRLRSDAFAAITHMVEPGGAITRGATGGVTLIAETDLGGRAQLRVRSDLGRGFYATGATFEQPRWAAEVLACISVHTGSR